jgi:hypothetical protein
MALAAFLALGFSSRLALAADIDSVAADATTVRQGERFQARVSLDHVYENPFDPALITVDALIATPSGDLHRLPAYWDRDTSRSMVDGREVIVASGAGAFRIRYAPMELGRHEVSVVARDPQGQDVAATLVFEVVPGEERGFVRVDPADPGALSHDDGTPYLPVGANLCWSTDPSAGYDLETYLASLAAAGGTWTRLWMTHFGEGWTLEWGADHPSGYYAGLGRYSVEVASRLDRVFSLAETLGIAIQLVLWQHSQLETDNWSSWDQNPYNAANGGPCDDSECFFLNPEALELSRRKLRYLVARYGAYRSLLAWEVMNELDGVHAPVAVVSSWNEDRARDLRSLDPYRHLVTTSVMVRPSLAPARVFDSDAYDISQAHAYGGAFWFNLPKDAAALRAHGKPAIFAEFGLDYLGETQLQDTAGLHLAEGSWIALASGFWGGTMSWWWDSYLRPLDLWNTQQGVASFAQSVDLRGMHEPIGEDVTAEAGDINLDVFGRKGATGAMIYLRHPDARWEIASKAGMPSVQGASVRVPCEPNSACSVRVFETAGGTVIADWAHVVGDAEGLGSVDLPAFVGSLALEVRPSSLSPSMPTVHATGGCRAATGPVRWVSLPWWVAAGLALAIRTRRSTRRRRALALSCDP